MSSETSTRPPEPTGVPGMLLVMSSLTLAGTIVICALIGYAEWWLLPVALGAVLAGAVLVAAVIVRALGEGNHDLPGPAEQPLETPAVAEARDDHAARRRSGTVPAASRRALRS